MKISTFDCITPGKIPSDEHAELPEFCHVFEPHGSLA